MKQFKTINQNKIDIEIGYKQEEPKIISDWLEQNRNPEIDKQVEKELEYLSKQETIEEAAENHSNQTIRDDSEKSFIEGAKWQQDKMLKFILDEDNHTEGELGNSCIDVQTLVHFIEQFKKK